MSFRSDNRAPEQMRPVRITPDYIAMAEGSALIEVGHTRVICTASVEESVPGFLRNSGKGWITSEYGMLPRSTLTRTPRESSKGRVGGRTHEIQRLIGRSLRAVADRGDRLGRPRPDPGGRRRAVAVSPLPGDLARRRSTQR